MPLVPRWRTATAALSRRWLQTWTQDAWVPLLDRAIGAYLDVLKQWALEQIADLERDVDIDAASSMVPITTPNSAVHRATRAHDVEWLRQAAAAIDDNETMTTM
ncbi:MAG: hypothetical protein QM736_16760 [Vicinamibacterales bacterium]